jgi:hypothetical protein
MAESYNARIGQPQLAPAARRMAVRARARLYRDSLLFRLTERVFGS